MYINKNDGQPFASEIAAKSSAARKKLEDFKIVKVENGYSILVEDSCEAPVEKDCEENTALEVSDDSDIEVQWQPPRGAREIIDPYKDPRFRYKWANPKMKEGTRVEQLKYEGWQIDREIKAKLNRSAYIDNHGGGTGTETIIQGHILMRIPVKAAEQRNKFYRDMANAGLKKEQDKLKEEAGEGLYGKMQIM